MSVIVHSNENIDSALKRLHREVLEKKNLETYKNKAYRIRKQILILPREKNGQKEREEGEQLREELDNFIYIKMSLIETIRKDMISATKDGNTDKLDILKLALASMINAQKAASEELKDVDFEKILKKEVKKVKDSIEQFSAIGRMELANREKRQLEVLESYLPKEMSSEDVAKIVKRIISEIKPEGSKDMGRVMGVVMKEVAGRADGNIVKEIVLEHLK